MHELGVVFYAIDAVEEAISERDDVSHVDKVTIELGEVSGVVPHLLQDCWKWAVSKRDIMQDCVLEIEQVHAITRCESCGRDYETVPNGITCPFCGSDETLLVCGNEFIVESVEGS